MLSFLLGQTAYAIRNIRKKELHKYKVPIRHSAVFFAVEAIGDRATPASISRWLLREPHTVSELLKRMEKKGLIKKVKDLDRKNKIRIGMTKKGQRAYRDSLKRESSSKVINCLSQKERQQLKSLLEKLRNRAFEELGVKDKPRLL